jgi:hypothetical protein
MAKARRVALLIVGGLQCGLGGFASVFAYLVYASSSIRDMLAIASDEVPLYMFLFLVFGMFSILSGFLLVHEKDSGS